MKITNDTMQLSTLFDLDDEDIFLYEGHYYIAGAINYYDHTRECYDLTINQVKTFTVNHTCYAWFGDNCELIIR